jgi:acetyltransferase-like isoleucine patch superfamily enzyme
MRLDLYKVRKALRRLRPLADPSFYHFFFRAALPAYIEQRRAGLHAGKGVVIHPSARICDPTFLRIGDHSAIGADCNIRPSELGITIGRRVAIAQRVAIIGDNHRFDDPDRPIVEQGNERAPVVIEDDVWIGASAIILCGVTIGRSGSSKR